MKVGKVWLVGAGPGDAGLFTLKGCEVLKKAEVVVYDSLVGQGVLTKIPDSARRIYVGKRADKHTVPQEQINEILLEEAKKGYRVVRLKGGDPFLFGRGGEELELLTENQIPYEVVPGVTSPLAVPAYNGIPVTHRDFCSSLHIITGHRRAGQEYDIDFEALVRTKGTLVFLMGVASLGDICRGLLDAGMDPAMPAAVLQKGTTAGQKRIVSDIENLPEEAARQGVETPAVIIVGKVCALADTFAWYEKLPLAGWKVLVTRPKNRSSRTSELLREKGAEVLELPSIQTAALKDQSLLAQALEKMDSYQWAVFTSPTGADVFFEEMKNQKKDIRCLHGVKLAAIGQGTRAALEARGLLVDLVPDVYDGDSLGKALAERLQGGERILIPRARKGNENLVRILESRGAAVDDIPTYETVYESSSLIDLRKELESESIDCAVFTSASTVRGFVESTKGADYSGLTAACIGKQTQAAADAFGMETYVSERAAIDDLVALVEKIKAQKERE
ncbi:MAG TPA: uroporphyrinogen-III C-methyltransferase [Candidatus Blautia intestinavium]|nr:uroporphyrinogen-III C-methyltransferase [Candidatus Blautia intestinavium]